MNIHDLDEWMEAVSEEALKKIITEYMMLVIAKAEKYDRIEALPWVADGCPDTGGKAVLRQIREILEE